MSLPPDLIFSQSSLQDLVDCRRRFQLRHLDKLAWPAIEAAPVLENEKRMRAGSQFHKLAHQFVLGIPEERLTALAGTEQLGNWWAAFLQSGLAAQEGKKYAEQLLSFTIAGHRLVAKYDLLLKDNDGKWRIYDWKTGKHVPKRETLERRMQSIIYPLVLLEAGDALNEGKAINPSQIEMMYWYAEDPGTTISFPYSQEQYDRDRAYIENTIEELKLFREEDFTLTDDERRCKYCVYRSLCGRGEAAGAGDYEEILELQDSQEETEIDFEQLAEVEF